MTATCPSCAKAVDPLRAGHVAIFDERFFYFCDVVCRERVVPRTARSLTPAKAVASLPSEPLSKLAATAAFPEAGASVGEAALPAGEAVPPASEPAPRSVRTSRTDRIEAPSDAGSSLLWVAVASGLLAISLVLAGMTTGVIVVRLGLAFAGWLSIAARALRSRSDPANVHPTLLLAPGLAACVIGALAWALGDPATEEATTFAGIVVTVAALAIALVERARHALASERARIAESLSSPADGDLRPGEELTIAVGERLPVDGTVVAGEAVVLPWIGAKESLKRREGDALLAGARVISGPLRVRATYTGFDRAWARLTFDPRRRADVHAKIVRTARAIADRGGPLAMLLAALAAFANGESHVRMALAGIAAYAAITTAAVGSMAAVHVSRGILEGLRRGVVYRGPLDWDRAGDVSIAAFCARGTLLLGEPELADLESVGKLGEEEVLALAAGAESSSTHPVAMAIQRSAGARRIRPDAVRSPIVLTGLGVTAVASSGETLAFGSRALMLKEKISVAIAEQKIAEIEAHGRQVLLIALAGKLVGVLGLQDGLRPGARAAVQHLLDAQVEPVLISGDSRETCEAIGRALDIEHVRPEILSSDRAVEIERLAQGGVTVAVLGSPRTDEAAMSAADVPVAMPSVGGASGEWGVMLASDDVRDGALAISLARRTKNEARTSLILAVAPGAMLALAVAFGLLPAAYAPLAALMGAVASGVHARATDLTRSMPASASKAPDFAGADAAPHNQVH
jgi:cation transport ATPase